LPTQGKLLKIALADGSAEIVASGFRTPNGIGLGPNDELFVTDNQGDWLPANKLVQIQSGGFYGSRVVPDEGVMDREELAPVVWLPQDEIGNSPTQPLLLTEGPYAGQMIHGDVTNGGIKRVFMESVQGRLQGAAFHFSAGFAGNVNRLVRGPDGNIYVGELGNPPNWGEIGKVWHGLERLSYVGQPAFEILGIEANSNGFTLTLTEPLAADLDLTADDLLARHWFYHPNEQYGGPKYDATELAVSALTLSPDRRQLRAVIPGLKAGYVVYLRLDPRLLSSSGDTLWVSEGWYTLNAIPQGPPARQQAVAGGQWIGLIDGPDFGGWRNYRGQPGEVKGWVVNDGMLEFQPSGLISWWSLVWSAITGAASGDLIYATEKFRNFELSLEWKISAGGNSGIFYLVADEDHNSPWETAPEMQVLDNDGHSDGEIHTHRAGDLYDLMAAEPETVKSPGEWNQVLLRIQDNQIEHWLNGVKVVAIERGGAEWNGLVAASKFADMPDFGRSDSGYIVLQDHGNAVWYRDIKVRKLD
jgi:cytochrome c